MWTFSPWALLPPMFSVGTAVGLWIVYFVAVYDEKIIPLSSPYRKINGSLYPPYISVAGNFPPASCIFSETMNLAAFLGFVIGLLRFLQLKNKMNNKHWLNYVSAAAFALSCFGMTLVGNFQLLEMGMIHNTGTLMIFGVGTLYCWMQSYITLSVNLENKGKTVAVVRFLLSAAITLCIILKQVLVIIPHMHTVRCQWALVMFFLIFIGTFTIEFRLCHLEMMFGDTVGPSISQSGTPDLFSQQEEFI